MDDDFSCVYDGLDEPLIAVDNEKLRKDNGQLLEKIKNLEFALENADAERMLLVEKQNVLTTNISELFNTAKREIERKDRMIADLREQMDSFKFRREGARFNRNYNNRQDISAVNHESFKKRTDIDSKSSHMGKRYDEHFTGIEEHNKNTESKQINNDAAMKWHEDKNMDRKHKWIEEDNRNMKRLSRSPHRNRNDRKRSRSKERNKYDRNKRSRSRSPKRKRSNTPTRNKHSKHSDYSSRRRTPPSRQDNRRLSRDMNRDLPKLVSLDSVQEIEELEEGEVSAISDRDDNFGMSFIKAKPNEMKVIDSQMQSVSSNEEESTRHRTKINLKNYMNRKNLQANDSKVTNAENINKISVVKNKDHNLEVRNVVEPKTDHKSIDHEIRDYLTNNIEESSNSSAKENTTVEDSRKVVELVEIIVNPEKQIKNEDINIKTENDIGMDRDLMEMCEMVEDIKPNVVEDFNIKDVIKTEHPSTEDPSAPSVNNIEKPAIIIEETISIDNDFKIKDAIKTEHPTTEDPTAPPVNNIDELITSVNTMKNPAINIEETKLVDTDYQEAGDEKMKSIEVSERKWSSQSNKIKIESNESDTIQSKVDATLEITDQGDVSMNAKKKMDEVESVNRMKNILKTIESGENVVTKSASKRRTGKRIVRIITQDNNATAETISPVNIDAPIKKEATELPQNIVDAVGITSASNTEPLLDEIKVETVEDDTLNTSQETSEAKKTDDDKANNANNELGTVNIKKEIDAEMVKKEIEICDEIHAISNISEEKLIEIKKELETGIENSVIVISTSKVARSRRRCVFRKNN